MRQRTRGSSGAGFTLLELIVVVAIVGILATMAMPALKNVPRKAAESVLKSDLRTFRDIIDQFHADKGYYPPTLESLVEEEYLRSIPMDPITKRTDTWVEIYEEIDPDYVPAETDLPEDGQPGIVDVRSGSTILSLSGTPYYEW
jgi:prepilin-type N-terminal cleavage/methylation domain-containing protein